MLWYFHSDFYSESTPSLFFLSCWRILSQFFFHFLFRSIPSDCKGENYNRVQGYFLLFIAFTNPVKRKHRYFTSSISYYHLWIMYHIIFLHRIRRIDVISLHWSNVLWNQCQISSQHFIGSRDISRCGFGKLDDISIAKTSNLSWIMIYLMVPYQNMTRCFIFLPYYISPCVCLRIISSLHFDNSFVRSR